MAWLGGLSVGLASVSGAIILWPERGPALVWPESSGEEGTSAVLFVVVERIAFPLMLAAGLAAVATLLWRFGRARGEERQQIKWFSYAAALTLSWTFVIDGLPDGAPPSRPSPTRSASSWPPPSPSRPASPSSATASTT